MKDYSSDLLNTQLKTIFEMLQILIANMEIKDGSLGYDFSYAEVLFEDERLKEKVKYHEWLDHWLEKHK
jgi:hypothetical protein|tara:strand:- start:568 stop:774 length:207 start_codon:yes stop_codon:yes gene_type:complete